MVLEMMMPSTSSSSEYCGTMFMVFDPDADFANAAMASLSSAERSESACTLAMAEARGTGLIQAFPNAASMSVPVDHLTHSTAASGFFDPAAAQKPHEYAVATRFGLPGGTSILTLPTTFDCAGSL